MEKFNKILLVEDEHVDAYISKRILQQMQISEEIIACKNGKDALDLLATLCKQPGQNCTEPELILLDISMPGMNGIEFLQQLRQTYKKKFTVVILSSSEDPSDISQVGKYQASYYLVKPLTEDKVKKMLERCF